MARISFVIVGKTLYQSKTYQHFQNGVKLIRRNRLKRSSRIQLLHTPGFFFHSFYCWIFVNGSDREGVNIVSVFHFLDTDIREQKKHEMRTQTSVDNAVNDLRYEIKVEMWKTKITFLSSETLLFSFQQKYILFLETFFF